jgi:membrane protease YdiL (CAAX protease family)
MEQDIVPSSIANGTVKAWHIVVLYTMTVMAAAVAAGKLTQSVDPQFRFALNLALFQAFSATLVIVLCLLLKEFRHSLPVLYARGRRELSVTDALLFIGLLFSWAFTQRLFVQFPLLQWNPDLYTTLGMMDHVPDLTPTYILLYLGATCVITPVTEELLFRGFLQNLLVHRWGLWPGIILSAVAFGTIHFQFAPFATIGGIFFSLLYLKYRTLWPGTLLHALYNLLQFALLLATPLLIKSRLDVASLSGWVPEICFTIAFFPLLFLFWHRFRPTA